MRHRAPPILVHAPRGVTEERATADRGVPSRGVHLEPLEMDEVDDDICEGKVGEAMPPTARLHVHPPALCARDDRRDLVRRPWARHRRRRGRFPFAYRLEHVIGNTTVILDCSWLIE
jgi:hypothetical protein